MGGGGPKLRKAIKVNIKFTILLKWVDLSLFDILKFPTLLDDDKDGFIKFVTVIEEAVVDSEKS